MRNPLRRKALTASPDVVEAVQDRRTNFYVKLGGTNQQIHAAFLRGQQASYGWMYLNQPAVRTVIDYIARNVAVLGLKCFERISDEERKRITEHPAVATMQQPDEWTTGDQWIFRFVADYLVYDNAYALKFRPEVGSKLTLIRLPPAQVSVSGGRFSPEIYRIFRIDGTCFDVKPEDIIHWKGYNPEDPLLGASKLETLRSSLLEDQVSQATTVELMKNGLKGGHIERPLDAPDWSEDGGRERFIEGWRNEMAQSGNRTPVLEEGMKYIRDAISPKDAEMLAGRKNTVEEVCRVYGLPPGIFGIEPIGDMDALRKYVYTDVLPPITETLASQLDKDLLVAEYVAPDLYFEFDLNEKLRGDPVGRFAAITSSVGAPWLTRNEARALENRPPVEGGDELITPANVIVGDNPLPAPNVMPPQDPNGPPQDGSHRTNPKALRASEESERQKSLTPAPEAPEAVEGSAEEITEVKELAAPGAQHVERIRKLLERYFQRQQKSVTKHNGEYRPKRWNRELTDDLYVLLRDVVAQESGVPFDNLGDDDPAVKALAAGAAEATNEFVGDMLRKKDLQAAYSAVQAAQGRLARDLASQSTALAALRKTAPQTVSGGEQKLSQLAELREGLGLPDDYVWKLAGFSEDEINEMRAMQLAREFTDAGQGG